MTSVWRRSPQDVDPLSWFTGTRMPIAFSVAAVIEGIVVTVAYWNSWSSVILQLLAFPFFLGAGWLTATSTYPSRPRFRLRDTVGILALACAGLIVSAIGTYGASVPVAEWWPGIALAVTLVSISPYCTPLNQLICSFLLVAVVGVVGWIVFSSQTNFWSGGAVVLIATGPVLIAAVGSIVFSYTFVSRTLGMLEISDEGGETSASAVTIDEDLQRDTVTRMSARVAPFLEAVASAGVITADNRALAAQIARRLRSELVSATERSWLDVVARETGMIVSDPTRLADSMNESQRTALRGLLVAALDSSVIDHRTLLIELRAQADGSTAVALSIDVDLPEGRRLVLLAPYYLTLKTTVDDLSWDDGKNLLMRFRIPPA
jgi:hypothetical protein